MNLAVAPRPDGPQRKVALAVVDRPNRVSAIAHTSHVRTWCLTVAGPVIPLRPCRPLAPAPDAQRPQMPYVERNKTVTRPSPKSPKTIRSFLDW
jgi:hypothetical protein